MAEATEQQTTGATNVFGYIPIGFDAPSTNLTDTIALLQLYLADRDGSVELQWCINYWVATLEGGELPTCPSKVCSKRKTMMGKLCHAIDI